VRKKVGDIRARFPGRRSAPFFNDEFGDTFGNIYAITGEGYTYAQLKETADRIRNELLRVKDVAKVDLVGEQDEKIYVESRTRASARSASSPPPSFPRWRSRTRSPRPGASRPPTDRIYVRASGALDFVESVKALAIRANGRLFRLGDIATVRRGFSDPPQPRMRFMGREALGVAVSMVPRGATSSRSDSRSTPRSRASSASCPSASSCIA
jgi:multidrug efflux pump